MKANSVAGQVQAHHQAQRSGLGWPSTVTLPPDPAKAAHAIALYAEILQSRPPELWKPVDRSAAAFLALALRQLDEIGKTVEVQGYVVRGNGKNGPGTGGEIVSPMLAALQQTSSRVETMSRRLNLGGLQVDGRTAANAARTFTEAGGSTYQPEPEPGTGSVVSWAARAKEKA